MTVARAVVFNRSGTMLAELDPEWGHVNWRLNNEGRCQFFVPWADPKCTRDNLRPGNRLLVEFDNGLPDWGGVIDLPRKREPGGVQVTGYTGEHLLDWRVTVKGRYFSGAAAGTIFRALLTEEAAEYPTGITVAEIYGGGEGRTLEYHYHDLLARCIDLARLSGHDFVVVPAVSNNVLSFEATWYQQRGADKSASVWLLDGANVMDPVMDEQGKLANRILLAGAGTTWDDDRITAMAQDATSIATYGYREYSEVQSGVKEQSTLQANANALLAEMKDPQNQITITALNEEPGTFAEYDIGDIVSARLFVDSAEWGFEAPVRIIAREWRPGDTCRLEVEEWAE